MRNLSNTLRELAVPSLLLAAFFVLPFFTIAARS
jgi:hypothetical protein